MTSSAKLGFHSFGSIWRDSACGLTYASYPEWYPRIMSFRALKLFAALFGYFADHCKSRRGPFTIGLIALGISTVFFMLARSPFTFILARAIQGISAAATWVVGTALVVDTVSEDRVGEALGYTSMAMTVGTLLGPTIGGLTWEKGQINGEEQPKSSQAGSKQRDEQSPLLASQDASNSTDRSNSPNIFQLLKMGHMQLALLATVLSTSTFGAFETLKTNSNADSTLQTLPLFVMETYHWSTRGAGLIFLALTLPNFAAVPFGKFVDKFGVRMIGPVICLLTAVATVCLRYVQENNLACQIILCVLLAIVGTMFIFVGLAAMTEISYLVGHPEDGSLGEKKSVSQAYALYNMAFSSGQLLGPIVGGSIKVSAGWGTMTVVLGVICALCSVPVGLFGERSKPNIHTERQENEC
ncbi:hypothetical protein N7462_003465 [Penicillium macrosclerotiorum]|uniref:uncharacterized protein n=1 Tax=Penicillium macrosclerotiorum TaxID=303699 RepID=UPI002546A444|nr:uncharacterized protein N7462_003465 [Penicillium macrosclerotiorum]KAJ5689073.1 hypothetical protein N7462_003465 [Penicillium macrosclerotiorum]